LRSFRHPGVSESFYLTGSEDEGNLKLHTPNKAHIDIFVKQGEKKTFKRMTIMHQDDGKKHHESGRDPNEGKGHSYQALLPTL